MPACFHDLTSSPRGTSPRYTAMLSKIACNLLGKDLPLIYVSFYVGGFLFAVGCAGSLQL